VALVLRVIIIIVVGYQVWQAILVGYCVWPRRRKSLLLRSAGGIAPVEAVTVI
jgi:hypothetical protein